MQAVRYLAGVSILLALSGCGGGGGGSDGNEVVEATQPEAPEVQAPNESAKAIINAETPLPATNVVIAVADSGVNTDHQEFDGTALDARSGAFAFDLLLGEDGPYYKLDIVASDDHFPDYEPDRDYVEASHGTHVASLIFGKETGILSDGTLLAMDVVYSGRVDAGTFDPIAVAPNVITPILGITELAKSHAIDFVNLSMDNTAIYANPDEFGDVERDTFTKIKDRNIGVITAAGNFALDHSEIYASDTPDCTEKELAEAQGDEYASCVYLNNFRHRSIFIPFSDDNLRGGAVHSGCSNRRK